MSKLRAWIYVAVFIAAIGAGVFLGRRLELNMPRCPGVRFAPAVFGGVFGMMALIALRGHGKDDSRSRGRASNPAPDPHPGGLDIYADFRFDLMRYETGEISLGQFLDRWAGRVPPKRNEASKDKNPGVRMVNATEDQAKTLLGMLANSRLSAEFRFKPGQWVRIIGGVGGGDLAQVLDGAHGVWNSVWYELATAGGKTILSELALEPAYPREGEWWLKGKCPSCDEIGLWDHTPTHWVRHDPSPLERRALECGCLSPLNFGRGGTKGKFRPGQWCRIVPAYRGMGLLAQIIGRSRLEGPGDERYEMMTAHGQMELGAYALEPALPRMGEWWIKERCGQDDAHGGTWLFEPVVWPSNFQISMAGERAALCGCYHPVNFGRGKPTVPAQPMTYRPGQWVRYKGNGLLNALMKISTPLAGGVGELWVGGEGGPLLVRESALIPAYPMRGEWWEKRDCPKVHKLPLGHGWIQGPWLWSQNDCDAVEREAVECGCLAPWNYGRPPLNAPPGPGNKAGGIYANGGAGGSGNCALIPPGDNTGSVRTE